MNQTQEEEINALPYCSDQLRPHINDNNGIDSDDGWGWDAVKMWWNPSCNKQCKKAESKLVEQFVDNTFYSFESKEIDINYDSVPKSIRKKESLKSKSWTNIFSFDSDSDDKNNNKNEPLNRKSQAKSAMQLKDIKTTDHKEHMHTATFKVLPNRLEYLNRIFLRKCSSRLTNIDQLSSSSSEEDTAISPRRRPRFHKMEANDSKENNNESNPTVQASNYKELRDLMDQYECASAKEMPPIVLMHGYGCASGIYIPSVQSIFERILSRLKLNKTPEIHLVDCLGHGMSSRPEFQCETCEETEDFFVESLDEWRQQMGFDKIILSGHSLGGYIACCYAMRYPQYIDHLILISPVGLPKRPDNSEENMQKYGWKVRTMFKTFASLWNSGWTPHDLIRMSGPNGKSLISKIVNRRLFRLSDNDPLKPLLSEYLYHVIAQQGSGEFALNKILQPGAWAHKPLGERIGQLKQYQGDVSSVYSLDCDDDNDDCVDGDNGNDEEKKNDDGDGNGCIDNDENLLYLLNSNMKIDFIYGTNDWMTSGHAVKIKQEKTIKCDVYINPKSGHQLILENAQGFANLFGEVVAKGQIC